MHFILISLLIITLLFQFNQATEIRMSSYDLLIKANITHKESNNTWYLAETVYFNSLSQGVNKLETLNFKPLIHGAIKIQKGDIEMQVIYHLNSSKRIVILDNRAMEMENIRNFTWNGIQLPVSTIRFINKLLILGPVYYYSMLDAYNYNEYEDEKSLKFRSNNDGQSLFWVYKFTASITPWVVLGELDSISISNIRNSEVITVQIVKFVALNSLIIEAWQQFYVGFNETLIDHINQSTVDTQFVVTKMTPISWMEYKRQGIGYEAVDDLTSGLRFTSTTDGCAIESSNQNDQFNFVRLSLHEVFWTTWTFRYTNEILFPVKYQHRDKFIMDKMDFNKKIDDFSYDLVVTTLRVPRMPEIISSDLVLQSLQVERKLYSKENKSSLEYQLIKTQKHFFSSYFKLNYEPGHQIYTLNNKCFQDTKIAFLTLRMVPSKKFSAIETYSLLNRLDELGENLKELIRLKLGISYLRMKSVRFQFKNTYLIASVEIIERFNFVDFLRKSYRKLDVSGFVADLSSDTETCLKLEANKSNVSKIISCNGINHGCIGIALDQLLPEENENGSSCVVYNSLDKALYKLVQEPTIRELEISYKHLNQTTLFSAKLSFDLIVNDLQTGFRPLNKQVYCKNSSDTYLFLILIVAVLGTVIGFFAFFCKSYRRTVRVSSSPSISLVVLKDS